MALDYLRIIQEHRENTSDHAAEKKGKKAPVIYRGGASKKKRLTKRKAQASLKTSTAEPRGKSETSAKRAAPSKRGSEMATKKSKKSKKATSKGAAHGAFLSKAKKAAKKAAATKKRNAAKRSEAAKKGARTKKAAGKKSGAHKGKKKGSKKAKKSGTRKSARSTHTTHTTRTEIIKLPGHTTKLAVVPVPTMARRSSSKKKSSKKKGSKKGKKSHKAKEAGYAMENPLSGTELFVGGITLLAGFLASDAVDRALATHALTDKNAKDANGNELYADNPPTDGHYAGLFNSTAILAPAWKDPKRWIVGGLVTVAPFVIAGFVKAPAGRSALQFFGFGYGARFFGKMLIDVVAMLTKKNQYGQRLYDAEMRAASLAAGADGYPLSSLPGTGLGASACGCQNCRTGVGACCGRTPGNYQPDDPSGDGPITHQQHVKHEAAPPPPPPPPPPAPTMQPAPALPPPPPVERPTVAASVPVITRDNAPRMPTLYSWGAHDGVS